MVQNGYMKAQELGIQNHICVLPYGENSDTGKALWSTVDLKPYQSYLVNGRSADRLFRGFIFNPINGREDHYFNPIFADFGELAEKEDWTIALKRLFVSNFNLDALAINTKPGFKTDIWVTIPYPNSSQTKFGLVEGRELNFKNDEDREEAIKWWISSFQNMWDQSTQLHESLTFKGFVWQRVSISGNDISLVKNVNNFIHSNGFLSLWLQQYGSCGCVDWKEFGFDASCTNPNFYGNSGNDFSWIANSTVFADYYHIGMQIFFGKGDMFKDRHLYDYLNYGVYNNYMNESLLVYQFPNQTMREIYENNLDEYIALYSFTRKTYKPVYPTAAFPA
ncbi:DUF4855 domain-containing protein [Bacillus sp. APMAM]|nr:DUF4855 domain-containing protein [Bacillus sp. APMAM]